MTVVDTLMMLFVHLHITRGTHSALEDLNTELESEFEWLYSPESPLLKIANRFHHRQQQSTVTDQDR